MTYTIAKRNIGSPRRFTTRGRLVAALKRHGALSVEFRPDGREIAVQWPSVDEGIVTCRYAVDPEGIIDEQLAWDL